MKIFLGVLLALIIGAFVFKLVKDKKPAGELSEKPGSAMVATPPDGPAKHTVMVEEVMDASSYTYMRVKEGKSDFWIATVKTENVAIGSKLSYGEALEMVNFKSKELDRTFDRIYFISEDAMQNGSQDNSTAAPVSMGKPKVELLNDVVIPQSPGGISIGELYKNRNNYANKKVRVKGRVVKVNSEVMDRNWVHLQDGTSDSGSFDLTVTTLESAKVDDVVEFEGTLILNKDFGAGYVYELILEGGVIRK